MTFRTFNFPPCWNKFKFNYIIHNETFTQIINLWFYISYSLLNVSPLFKIYGGQDSERVITN
jgi:hypothetical protein